jgi:predicted TIM-barrel fold metal-dependent hydrolase
MPRPPSSSGPFHLGLVGALINGHSQGRYLDDPAYYGLFDTAQRLDVPIYLHPTTPHPAVMDACAIRQRRASPGFVGIRRGYRHA